MAKYRITAPDGKSYVVEGSGSQDEALAHFQANWKPEAPPEKLGGVANVLAPLDASASFGSGMVAAPISGLAGLAGAALPGPAGQGANWQQRVSELLTRKPQTQGGEMMLKAAGLPFELLHKGGVALGEKAQDAGASPGVATAVQTAVETAPGMLIPGGAKVAAKGAEGMATGLMRSSLKPPKSAVLSGDADSAIMTMLKDGTMPTKGGLEKMRNELDALDQQITDAVANSNGNVNKLAIGKLLSEKLNEVRKQANPDAAMKDVRDAWVEFVNHPLLQNSNLIPVQLAQEMKRATSRALGKRAYDQQQTPSAEAQKTIVRGLKEGVADAVPEAAPINARMSELINASDLLENRLAVSGNQNPLGWSPLAHHGYGFLAALLDKSGAAKGALAHGLYGASRPTGLPPGALEAILAAQQGRR